MPAKISSFRRFRAAARAYWDDSALSPEREASRLHRFVHFWFMVCRSFYRNRCPVRASALAYTTLLAFIPILGVALSITGGLLKGENEDQIYHFIDRAVATLVPPTTISSNAPDRSGPITNRVAAETNSSSVSMGANGAANLEVDGTNAPALASPDRVVLAQKQAASYIHGFIQNIRSGTLGTLGMVFLIFVAISMVSRIEETLNDIWGVTRGRNWRARVEHYWLVMSLGPVVLAAAIALLSGPRIKATQEFINHTPFVGAIVLKVLPLIFLWLVFALFYRAVPNTKVHFDAALVGGVVGGTLWHLNNLCGFLYVSRVVTNSKIYGGLALVPVFMAALYLSWLILLFGAQVAYAFQNRALYYQEKLAENVNQRGREFVALRLMTCLGQRFQRGLKPPTILEMSGELGVPSRLVQQVLQTLLAARLVSEVAGAEPAYLPARPLEAINAHHLLMAMRATQGQELIAREDAVQAEVYGEYARIQEAEKRIASGISLLGLVNRTQTRLELAPVPQAEKELKLAPALVPHHEEKSEIRNPKSERNPKPEIRQPKVGSEEAPFPKSGHAVLQSASGALNTDPSAESDPKPAPPVVEPTPDEDRDFPL